MMRAKHWLAGAAALIAIVAAFVWAFLPQPIPVDVAAVTRGAFEQSIDEDGKTRVRERYVVSAPLTGELARVEIHAGDDVQKDQVIAVLCPSAPALLDARTQRELEERVGSAEANLARSGSALARARAALDQAHADSRRTQQLAQQGFVAQANREQAQLAVQLRGREAQAAQFERDAASHQLDQARAALTRARAFGRSKSANDAAFEVRAPVSGRVLRVAQENEGVIGIGATIMELADPTDLEVVVDVLSTDAVQIRPAAMVHLEAGVGVHLQGRVRLVEPSAFTKISALGVEEQRVNVIIDLSSGAERLARLGDGYRVDARIVVASARDALKVPVGALFREDGRWMVYTVADGRARRRDIKLGPRNAVEAVVEDNLKAGELVALYPSDSVREGVRVDVRATGKN
jgi:HlyD family secretion protein